MFLSEQNRLYTTNDLLNRALGLRVKYPDLITVTAKYLEGREKWCVGMGKGEETLFVRGGWEENPVFLSMALLEIIDFYCKMYYKRESKNSYSYHRLLQTYRILVFPGKGSSPPHGEGMDVTRTDWIFEQICEVPVVFLDWICRRKELWRKEL